MLSFLVELVCLDQVNCLNIVDAVTSQERVELACQVNIVDELTS